MPTTCACSSLARKYHARTRAQSNTNCFPTFRKRCVLKSNGARRHRIYFKACRGNNKDLFVHNCSLLQPDHQSDKVRRFLKTWQVIPFSLFSYLLQCAESTVKTVVSNVTYRGSICIRTTIRRHFVLNSVEAGTAQLIFSPWHGQSRKQCGFIPKRGNNIMFPKALFSMATKAFFPRGIKLLKPEADKLPLSMAESVTSPLLHRDDTIYGYSSWLAFVRSDFCLNFVEFIVPFRKPPVLSLLN